MSSPIDQIREHLRETGRPGRTTAAKLLSQWGLDGASAADRDRVERELVEAGLRTVPPLQTVRDPDAPLRVELVDAIAADRLARAQRAAGRAPEPPASAALPADAAAPHVGLPPVERRMAALLAAGAAGLVVSLFLPWYSGDRGGQEVDGLSTGWEWLSILDVLLVVVALAAVALLVVRERAVALAVLGLGAVATFCCAVRVVDAPEGNLEGFVLETSVSVGPFVAVAAAAAVVSAAGAMSGLAGPRPRAAAAGRT
jgi:hypothetical protein